MASLTETAYYTRRGINWAILALIVYLILRLFWGILVATWLFLFPPKAPPPNHAFGALPALEFPPRDDASEITFTLETISGTVAVASDSAFVYFMPKKAPNLLAITQAQEFAKRLLLNSTPIQETKNIYRFDDDTYRLRSMRYDIVSNNFILKYDFSRDIGLFANPVFRSADALVAEAKALLQNHNLYVDDLSGGSTNVTFLKLTGNQLFPIGSLSQADAVKVDFYRTAVGDARVFTPFPDDGQISFIFSGSEINKKRVLQFAYTFWPIDYNTSATYSLKPALQAWQELQEGGGYIARYPQEGSEAIVREVYLGYYDSFDPQTYLQPIYVFEGDHGFLAYVHAVNPDWVEGSQQVQE